MKKTKSKMRIAVEFLCILILSLTFIIVGNHVCSYEKTGSDINAESAKVVKIKDIQTKDIDGMENTVITFDGKVLTGEHRGEVLEMEQDINEMTFDKALPVKEGNRILVTNTNIDSGADTGAEWYYFQQDRIPGLVILGVFFLLVLLLIGRAKGVTTIVALGFTCAAVFCVYIPAILSGKDIYIATIIVTIYIIVASLALLNGLNKKTLCAIVGNIGGIVLAGVLALIANSALKITGMVDETYIYLANVGSTFTIDLKAIVWSSILIGSLGAIMDVAMSIASAMHELASEMKDRSFSRMVRSGMNIGRDAIGTMTNTLILAYTGSSIGSLLLFMVNNRSINVLMNLEVIVVEVIQAIVGSLGILLAVPVTVLFASWIFNKEEDKAEALDN